MKVFANDAASWAAGADRNQMKYPRLIACLLAVAVSGLLSPVASSATDEDGVAVAIIYDTSGSMRETVKDANGKPTPKYVIANRALSDMARQIQTFSTNTTGAARKVQAGVFIFDRETAKEAVKFGPFDEQAIENWARQFSSPSGNTPLGNALTVASRAVLDSPLNRKHILVITDGINTAGPTPATVWPKLKKRAEGKGTSLSAHFVAFDVDAKVFDQIKQQGVTVVGAADEKQLDSQLQFIMQKKILLEDEEPAKKP